MTDSSDTTSLTDGADAAIPPTNLDLLPPEDAMETRLRDFFQENYEMLRVVGGHQLAPEVLNAAFQQVLLYWRKLHDVAARVTETEVKLTLPDQKTPQGRTFGIEGVVDIVREDDLTIMYDLKTHDAGYVAANLEKYAPQLNVYAHIWQGLRGQPLDETAIISTVLPIPLREALNMEDTVRADREMAKWTPLIPVPFDQHQVQQTVEDFGRVVDAIEEHQFAPPPVEKLKSQLAGQAATFATNVCRNCDARFSCTSYRAFALKSGAAATRTFRQYFQENVTDAEHDDWLSAGLSASTGLSVSDFDV